MFGRSEPVRSGGYTWVCKAAARPAHDKGWLGERHIARCRARDPEFCTSVLDEAVGALLRGEVEVGTALADLASATGAELFRRLEDQTDAVILRERLEDGDVCEYVPHSQVVAQVE